MHRWNREGEAPASESATERRVALIFLLAMSLGLAVIALMSLLWNPPQTEPGIVVTAVLLLAGAGYGAVSSSVALARIRFGAPRDDSRTDSAAE